MRTRRQDELHEVVRSGDAATLGDLIPVEAGVLTVSPSICPYVFRPAAVLLRDRLGKLLVQVHILGLQLVELRKRLGHRLEPPSEVETDSVL